MKRTELEHVLRASAAITNDASFVVAGSQAVLLPCPDAPADLLLSNEVDLCPAVHPEKADLIDGAIGRLSLCHDTFGYCVDGVVPPTATMPADWMKFSTLCCIGEITVVAPDLHDLAVSKCVAARDQDAQRARALLRHRMIGPLRREARLRSLDAAGPSIEKLVAWAPRRAREAET